MSSMIHNITALAPRWKKPTRKGRGESSGKGKTSGKGNKGSKARNGKYIKRGYEGGQTPIFRRLPKRGFSNVNFTTRYHVVNLSDLEAHVDIKAGTIVDQGALIAIGLIPDDRLGVKILGDGELKKKLTIHAAKYSKSAYDSVIKAGGSALNAKGDTYEFPKVKKKFIPRPKTAKKAEAAAPAEGDKKE
jgi:large subunit ribosomal protein L15